MQEHKNIMNKLNSENIMLKQKEETINREIRGVLHI